MDYLSAVQDVGVGVNDMHTCLFRKVPLSFNRTPNCLLLKKRFVVLAPLQESGVGGAPCTAISVDVETRVFTSRAAHTAHRGDVPVHTRRTWTC